MESAVEIPEDDPMPDLQKVICRSLVDYEKDKAEYRKRLNDPEYGSKLP